VSLQRPSRQDRGGQGAQRTRSATPCAPCRGHACPSSVEGQASPLRSRRRITPHSGDQRRSRRLRRGLPSLLTVGSPGVTVMEFGLRRSLQNDQVKRPSLHPEHRQKRPDTPTSARLLPVCADVSLPILKTAAGEDILQRLTPLSALQQDILQRLGLGVSLYQQLETAISGEMLALPFTRRVCSSEAARSAQDHPKRSNRTGLAALYEVYMQCIKSHKW